MYPFFQIWLQARKALSDKKQLEGLKQKHEELAFRINKSLIRLKSQGHVMGMDLRNNHSTAIFVPNHRRMKNKKEEEHSAIKELKTIRLDHRITTELIRMPRHKLEQLLHDEDNIDHTFAQLAMDCKDMINTSRVLKVTEMHKGELYRNYVFAIRNDDDKIEYY